MTFSERLISLRNEANETQDELAQGIGVSKNSVYYYENNKRVPDANTIVKISQHYRVTTDYVLGLTECRTLENAEISKITGLSDKAINELSFLNHNILKRLGGTRTINLLLERGDAVRLALDEYWFGNHDRFNVIHCDAPLNIDGEQRELIDVGGINGVSTLYIGYGLDASNGKTGNDSTVKIDSETMRQLAWLRVTVEADKLCREPYGDSDNGDGNKA